MDWTLRKHRCINRLRFNIRPAPIYAGAGLGWVQVVCASTGGSMLELDATLSVHRQRTIINVSANSLLIPMQGPFHHVTQRISLPPHRCERCRRAFAARCFMPGRPSRPSLLRVASVGTGRQCACSSRSKDGLDGTETRCINRLRFDRRSRQSIQSQGFKLAGSHWAE